MTGICELLMQIFCCSFTAFSQLRTQGRDLHRGLAWQPRGTDSLPREVTARWDKMENNAERKKVE